jgi:hypothetical protein
MTKKAKQVFPRESLVTDEGDVLLLKEGVAVVETVTWKWTDSENETSRLNVQARLLRNGTDYDPKGRLICFCFGHPKNSVEKEDCRAVVTIIGRMQKNWTRCSPEWDAPPKIRHRGKA